MKLFPVMAEYGHRIKEKTTDYIPYEAIEPHERQAMQNHGQTLKRLAERGGLYYCELLAVLEDRQWTEIEQSSKRKSI